LTTCHANVQTVLPRSGLHCNPYTLFASLERLAVDAGAGHQQQQSSFSFGVPSSNGHVDKAAPGSSASSDAALGCSTSSLQASSSPGITHSVSC